MAQGESARRPSRAKDTHAPLASDPRAEASIDAFLAALGAVDPTVLVRRAVRQGLLDDWFGDLHRPSPIAVLALGKAAPRMLWGLVEASVPFHGVGVAPKGVQAPSVDTFRWFPGNHPIPGAASFAAGREVLAWIDALPMGTPVLALLSGGASACVEVPAPGLSEGQVMALHGRLLTQAIPVEAMNRERASASLLKAGGLARRLLGHLGRTAQVRCWVLCDTDPGQPDAVGSGPLWVPDRPEAVPHHVLASSVDLVGPAGLRLAALGHAPYRYPTRVQGPMRGEVEAFVRAAVALPPGSALVGAGEAQQAVPPGAPRGGRCHHAALEAARAMAAHALDGVFMAAASDGVDGSSGGTGAWVRGPAGRGIADADPGGAATGQAGDWDDGAQAALAAMDAARWLRDRGRTFDLGATGTNVNDLWVLLR